MDDPRSFESGDETPRKRCRVFAHCGATLLAPGYAAVMTAEEWGRLVGEVTAPFIFGFLAMAVWGWWRADSDRWRHGLRYAWHIRSLALVGFLWLASALGRAAGA